MAFPRERNLAEAFSLHTRRQREPLIQNRRHVQACVETVTLGPNARRCIVSSASRQIEWDLKRLVQLGRFHRPECANVIGLISRTLTSGLHVVQLLCTANTPAEATPSSALSPTPRVNAGAKALRSHGAVCGKGRTAKFTSHVPAFVSCQIHCIYLSKFDRQLVAAELLLN
jgi:hypothetical protein